MPSTDTLTAFYEFSALQTVESAKMNANFNTFRGHNCPVDPLLGALADAAYDLGSSTHRWRNGYFSGNIVVSGSTITAGYSFTTTGSPASPYLVTTGGSIVKVACNEEIKWVRSNAGAIEIPTGTTQLQTGTAIGQKATLIGVDDSLTVSLHNGDNLSINGVMLLAKYSAISFVWDGTLWNEISRRD